MQSRFGLLAGLASWSAAPAGQLAVTLEIAAGIDSGALNASADATTTLTGTLGAAGDVIPVSDETLIIVAGFDDDEPFQVYWDFDGGLKGDAAPASPTPTPTPSPGGSTTVIGFYTPAMLWHVVHNLGRYPSVIVVDTANDIVLADVKYVDANTIDINFSASTAGTVFLN